MTENREVWEKICIIQASLKKVVLEVEQISLEQTLVQVALEQRNALDHMIRAKSRELKFSEGGGPGEEDRQYIQDNFIFVVFSALAGAWIANALGGS